MYSQPFFLPWNGSKDVSHNATLPHCELCEPVQLQRVNNWQGFFFFLCIVLYSTVWSCLFSPWRYFGMVLERFGLGRGCQRQCLSDPMEVRTFMVTRKWLESLKGSVKSVKDVMCKIGDQNNICHANCGDALSPILFKCVSMTEFILLLNIFPTLLIYTFE